MTPSSLDPMIAAMLAEIGEDEELSSMLGVDLSPAGPSAARAPPVYLPHDAWLLRSEEVHRFLRAARTAEHRRHGG